MERYSSRRKLFNQCFFSPLDGAACWLVGWLVSVFVDNPKKIMHCNIYYCSTLHIARVLHRCVLWVMLFDRLHMWPVSFRHYIVLTASASTEENHLEWWVHGAVVSFVVVIYWLLDRLLNYSKLVSKTHTEHCITEGVVNLFMYNLLLTHEVEGSLICVNRDSLLPQYFLIRIVRLTRIALRWKKP